MLYKSGETVQRFCFVPCTPERRFSISVTLVTSPHEYSLEMDAERTLAPNGTKQQQPLRHLTSSLIADIVEGKVYVRRH